MTPTTPEARTATHADAREKAQAGTRTDARLETGAGASEHPLIPAGRVNGTDVYNQAHEKIGRIEDIALDKRSGRVAYAILSFGGLWGMGEKHHPLPWSALDYDPQLRGYVTEVTKELLELAPKLDVSELSGWDDTERRDAYFRHYGAQTYW